MEKFLHTLTHATLGPFRDFRYCFFESFHFSQVSDFEDLTFPRPSSKLLELLVYHPGIEDTQTAGDIPRGLKVGSMVEVPMGEGCTRYGVIRWIGQLPQVKNKPVAGLELVRLNINNWEPDILRIML